MRAPRSDRRTVRPGAIEHDEFGEARERCLEALDRRHVGQPRVADRKAGEEDREEARARGTTSAQWTASETP